MMNRTYTQEEFRALVDKTRQIIPGIAISTDVIVGFSGETDEEFEETFQVMKDVEFDSAFMFKYSERKNTIASKKHPDDVPEAIKTERIVRLNELQKDIVLKKNRTHIGQTLNVLIENKSSERNPGFLLGRADNNKLVMFPDEGQIVGTFVDVIITDASAQNLKANAVKL